MRLGEAMRSWAAELEAAGCPEPHREALLIAAHVLGVEPGRAAAMRAMDIHAEALRRADAVVRRRKQRIPLQYIFREAHFYGMRFLCDQRVLVPRPETELLVDAALEALAPQQSAVMVDVGTGCGCVAVAIAARRPRLKVLAVDVSEAAVEVARENVRLHGLQGRVVVLCGDLLEPIVSANMSAAVELLVANLPYVAEAEWQRLQPEVRQEPREALVAGPTGVEVYARLGEQMAWLPRLRWFAAELSATRAAAIADVLRPAGFRREIRRDYAGHQRVLIGRRACAGRPTQEARGEPGDGDFAR